NDSTWETVQIPHDWAVRLPFVKSPNSDVMSHGYKPVGGLFPERSIGWYRKKFSIARSDSGKRFLIEFDGVYRNSMIWLNGQFVGNNQSGYIGKKFDVTDIVNFDNPNVLVVRVDATQYEGWFYEGAGIYRHVWLNRYENLHIKRGEVFVHTDGGAASGIVTIETPIENQSSASARGAVRTLIADNQGRIVARSRDEAVSAAVNKTSVAIQHVTVKNPHLWSLEQPYLYRAMSILLQDGKPIDTVITRFGIRFVKFDAAAGVLLNGKPVKIQGVCCHQDHAGVGSALPDYLQYYRIALLKEMGVNAYRTSHNPPTPELLDACDSLGMLVLDETRLLNSGDEYLSQFERLILRDRNHPSVLLWSIGNEEGRIHTTSMGKRVALSMIAKQQELDPSRTSTYAANVANVFRGVNEVIPVRGFNYHNEGILPYHAAHPTQPLLSTEMGSTVTTRGVYEKDTVRCYVPDQDITFPPWASRAEDWWPMTQEHAWMLGGFVWTGFDYRGEPTPYEWPNINSHFGIMDMCGFPKNIYYYYQSWWRTDDVLHISPHWNWRGSEGKPITVWVNSNADSVELFVNGASLGMKQMKQNSHLTWNVSYAPGAIEAVGYRHGKKITSRRETTGEPVEVVLTPSKSVLASDGVDAAVVNVSVIDARGREVPDAQMPVQFSLTGSARFIGVGNGDPSSHEPDQCGEGQWQRSLFNGKCQVIIQSLKGNDPVKIEARAAGVKPASAIIRVK
ncbi:MAG TPA: beta-galactosidase GalA, partial [Bacteroidota bacterium]|nr:beta-galactosidase GalA [Bacteroidota bacterium]